MIDAGAVEGVIGQVADLVRADGGDLFVREVTTDTIELDLVLETADCRECVMPRAFLEQVALDMLAPVVPGLRAVQVHDPRE